MLLVTPQMQSFEAGEKSEAGEVPLSEDEVTHWDYGRQGSQTTIKLQNILRELNNINFIGADVVEVSPPFDINNMTSHIGATIAFEILCTMTRTN